MSFEDVLIVHGLRGVLVLARVGGLVATAPAWNLPALGVRIRVGIALFLTLVLTPLIGPGLSLPASTAALASTFAGEVAIGAGLGLVLALIVSAAQLAGEVLGMQAGLSPAAVFDPGGPGTSMTPLGHLYGLVALALFVALDGPMRLVELLVESYQAMPPGVSALSAAKGLDLAGRLDEALALALRAAAPVALALVVAGVVLNLVARGGSGLGLVGLTFPARWVLALVLVLAGLGTMAALFSEAWMSMPGPLAAPLR